MLFIPSNTLDMMLLSYSSYIVQTKFIFLIKSFQTVSATSKEQLCSTMKHINYIELSYERHKTVEC